MPAPLAPPVWVDQPAALERMVRDLRSQPRLAVDTESNSLHAFHEQVCLIQFSTRRKDYLLDPLDLKDLHLLAPIFANPKIEKVFHAVEYDLIGLKRDFNFELRNIFDTMQSARILGYKQVGLDAMLALKFNLQVDKRYQKADWAYRPLTPEMLNYARLDTHYLVALRDVLQKELKAAGRWELAREEFVRMAKLNGNGRVSLPSWQRMSGIQKMAGSQLAILKELCDWRDQVAEQRARPVFKVLDDRRLAAIAAAQPERLKDLEAILTETQRRQFGAGVLQAVRRGQACPPLTLTRQARPRQAVLNRANLLSQWRKEQGQKLHMESDIILPKSWMQSIAETDPRTLEQLAELMPDSPWRLEQFGEQILKVIR